MWPQRASPLPSALARRIERCRWERATTRRRRRPRRPSDAYMFSPSLHLSPASLLPSAVFLLRVSACVPLPVWRPRPSLATPVARRWSVRRSVVAQTQLSSDRPVQAGDGAVAATTTDGGDDDDDLLTLRCAWESLAAVGGSGELWQEGSRVGAVAVERPSDGRRQSDCACACVGDLGLEALSSERPSNLFCPSSHRGRIPRGKGN